MRTKGITLATALAAVAALTAATALAGVLEGTGGDDDLIGTPQRDLIYA
jgi:hypothetical protein